MRTSRPHLLLLVVLFVAVAPLQSGPVWTQSDPNVLVDPLLYRRLEWRSVGPHRGGRVTAIAGVRQQPCTFYMGATGGGVWKTETCGDTWTPVSDGQIETGSIGSIDVSESNPNVVYVGTGSAAIRSNVIIGRGVYRSDDAGRTWRFIGLRDSGQVGDLQVHPGNPDVAWVAALGSPFGPNEERGIFKTSDGGKTWKRTLFVDAEHGGRSIAIDYSNPNVLYAAMYRGLRKGWDIISGGPADKGGIYKSADGGESWTKLANGLPRTLIGKIDVEVARSNPSVLYAIVEAPGDQGGLYRSDDGGASWRLVNSSPSLRARPFYFHYVDVNPKDANEVWVNELRLHQSTDGGKTFRRVETPHGDNHGMWFNPDKPEIILQGNDGGANVSINGGRTWSTILNQPTAELYMVAVDEQHPYRLYAPQQDNSTIVVPSVPPVSWGYDHPAMSWMQASGCETGQIAPRPDGKVIWGVCKGEVGRYNVETGQEQHYWIYPQNRYGHDPDEIRERFPRQSVVHVSPHDPKTVYHASHRVFVSRDEGVTWERLSDDLTAREPEYQVIPGNPITRDITGEEVYSSLYAFTESRLERGVLWAGANDGPVHVSRDGGKTWRDVTPPGLVGARIQNIEDSPHRKGSAYIAAYRFLREHDLRPYIYVTNDYGKTWTKLTDGTNGIPADHPTRVVREDPAVEGLLYAGTEFGFFVSFDHGAHWQALQQNLPATPVTDLRVHRGDLVISTMGRSFWIMDDITPLRQLAALRTTSTRPGGGVGVTALSGPVLLAPPERPRYRSSQMVSGPDMPRYPEVGLAFDYFLPKSAEGDLKLEILDSEGRLVRVVEAGAGPGTVVAHEMRGSGGRRGIAMVSNDAGHNRFVWDYRWTGPWTPSMPQGGPGGPFVAPGRYTARLTALGTTRSVPFTVQVDPRVLTDNVSEADLVAQQNFLLQVRDAMSDARRLQARLEDAMTRAKVAPAPAPAAGEDISTVRYASPLQKLWAQVVDAPGPYPKPVLISQLANVARMLGQADQKVGRDAYERLADLVKELRALEAQADKLARPAPSARAR